MNLKHTFSSFEHPTQKEHRLIFKDGPEVRPVEPLEAIPAQESAEVTKALESILYKIAAGDEKLSEFIRDPERKKVLLSTIEQLPGKRVLFNRPGQVNYREAHAQEQRELVQAIKQAAFDAVKVHIETLRTTKDTIKTSADNLKDPKDEALKKTILKIIDDLEDNDIATIQALANLLIDLLAVDVQGKSVSEDALKTRILNEKIPANIQGNLITTLINGDLKGLIAGIRTALEDEVEPKADAKKEILKNIGELDKNIVEADEAYKTLMFKSSPERARYLHLLVGSQPESLIKASRQTDFKINFERMQVMLETMLTRNPKDLKAGLQSAVLIAAAARDEITEVGKKELVDAGFKEAELPKLVEDLLKGGVNSITGERLIDAWKGGGSLAPFVKFVFGKDLPSTVPNTEADVKAFVMKENWKMSKDMAERLYEAWDKTRLIKHLETDEYDYKNPAGIDAIRAYERAVLPKEFVEHIEKMRTENKDIEKDSTTTAAAKKKLNTATTSADTFIQLASLQLEKIWDPAAKRYHLSETSAKKIIDHVSKKKGSKIEVDRKLFAEISRLFFGTVELSKDTGITDDGKTLTLNDSKKLLEKLKNAPSQTYFNFLSQLVEFQKTDPGNVGWKEAIEKNAAELLALGKVGGGAWLDYITALPNLVNGKDKDAIEAANNRIKALRDVQEKLKGTLSSQELINARIAEAEQKLSDAEKVTKEKEKALTTPLNVETNKQQVAENMRRRATTLMVHDAKLRDLLAPVNSEEVRLTARFLALEKGIEAGVKYATTPSPDKLDDATKNAVQKDIDRYKRVESVEGSDILAKIRNELFVNIKGDPRGVLARVKQLEPVDGWINNPPSAKKGLQAILFDIPQGKDKKTLGGKQLLIDLFCDPSKDKFIFGKDENGKDIEFSRSLAIEYVQIIQQRLGGLSEMETQKVRQLKRKERFTNPLELLRAGKDSLTEMLQSGDPIKQALAVTAIVSIGAVVWNMWKNGLEKDGKTWNWRRKMLVGLPLFFAADHVMKDMTGKGALERLGLVYMSEEDKKSPVEQFLRQQNKNKGYEELNSDAGFESMKALDKVTLKDLYAWRSAVLKQPGEKKFSEGAPEGVASGSGRVLAEMGNMSEYAGKPNAARREDAYRLMFKAMEALFIDVAIRNNESPTIDSGMNLVQKRYLKFNEAQIPVQYRNNMKAIAAKKGGYTFGDVLVFERPTPAMTHELFENDTFLEMLVKGSGIGKDKVVNGLKRGLSVAQIFAQEKMAKTPQAAEDAWNATKTMSVQLYNYVNVGALKVWDELDENIKAAYDGLEDVLTTIGVTIQSKGPDVLQGGFDLVWGAGEFTKDSAYALYKELHAYQVTGSVLEEFEKLMQHLGLIKGPLMPNAEQLTNKKEWIAEIQRRVSKMGKPPSDGEIKLWVSTLPDESDPAKENAKGNFIRFQAIEKKIFSLLMAERIHNIAGGMGQDAYKKVPTLKDIKWPAAADFDSGVENKVGDIYRYIIANYDKPEMLALIGNEKTLVGNWQRFVKANPNWKGNVAGVPLKPGIIQFLTYDGADDYLKKPIEDFTKKLLADAKTPGKFGNNKAEYEQYERFVNTFIMNAIIREAIKTNGKPSLTPDLAANISSALNAYGGDALELGVGAGETFRLQKLALGETFKEPPAVVKPGEIDAVLDHPRGSLILEGETPSDMTPVNAANAPAAGPSQPVGLTQPQREQLNAIENIPSSELVGLLRNALADVDKSKITKDFDRRASEWFKNPADQKEGYLILRGVSTDNVKKISAQLLPKLHNTFPDLSELNGLTGNRNQEKNTEMKNRIQKVLDSAVKENLKLLSKHLRDVTPAGTLPAGEHDRCKTLCLELYRATDPNLKDDPNADAISYLLEKILYDGKNLAPDGKGRTGYEKHKAYLSGEKLKKPVEEDGRWAQGWRRMWGTKQNSFERMSDDIKKPWGEYLDQFKKDHL